MSIFIVILLGIIVGLVMGLTGAGGGMLAVPSLVYTQGWSMQQAMPVALLAVSGGALIGAIEGLRKKQVRYKAAILMAIMGAPMTSFGVQAAQQMSQKALMLSFAGVLCIVAGRLLYQSFIAGFEVVKQDALAKVNQSTGRFDWNAKTAAVIATIGACAGFVTGLLGVGGGFVIVPLLRHFSNLTIQGAVSTSLMVIALVGSSAVFSAVSHGASLPLPFSLFFLTTSILGVLIGMRIMHYFSAKTVQALFAALLILVALSFVFKAWQM
jgi:uncharacterized membrane protein YfcA